MLNDSHGDYLSSTWQNNANYVTHKECKTSRMRFIRFTKKNVYIIAKSCRIAEIC